MERIRNYVVLDLEMTGLDAKKDRVTEIGALRIREGQTSETFSCLVNPGMDIPEKVQRLTGITNEMAAKGRDMDAAMEELLLFLGEDILVGQNIRFDYSFLAQWCIDHRRSIAVKAVDTLKLARLLLPAEQSKKLEDLCEYFEVPRENAHRALDDARETYQIFEKLQDLAALQPENEGSEKEGLEKLLTPKPLFYKAKRQTPATARQIEHLKRYRELHGIEDEIRWESLTRSEASRLQDQYFTRYGR